MAEEARIQAEELNLERKRLEIQAEADKNKRIAEAEQKKIEL